MSELNVKIKLIADNLCTPKKFQFLMVRLKAFFEILRVLYKDISIPYGSIKSFQQSLLS